VVASLYHLASLGQFYVHCSTDLASNCVIEIFALPGIHQQVFCPLYSGRLRISYFIDERCKLSFMLALEAPPDLVNYQGGSRTQCLAAGSRAAIVVGLSDGGHGYVPVLPLFCLSCADTAHGNKKRAASCTPRTRRHKIELLGPVLGIVTLVGKQALRSPVLRTTAIVGVGAQPKTYDLDLSIHPSEVLVFGSAMDPGVSALFFDDFLSMCIAFIQLLL